jgi:tetratricopeptide (TPR) repeat protein
LSAIAEAPSAPPDERQQAELFERAMKLFQMGGYSAARELFETAALGPIPAMAHSAQLHSAMCARRVGAREPSLATPEEHYDYAVTLINEGRFPEAERHLAEAVARVPDADHVHYALALCSGLSGDVRGACRHLRRAIEIEPRNRIAARNDPDFAGIGQLSPLFELLYPERTAAASSRF